MFKTLVNNYQKNFEYVDLFNEKKIIKNYYKINSINLKFVNKYIKIQKILKYIKRYSLTLKKIEYKCKIAFNGCKKIQVRRKKYRNKLSIKFIKKLTFFNKNYIEFYIKFLQKKNAI